MHLATARSGQRAVAAARAVMARRRRVGAIVFDMDGTLTVPGAIDFASMRARVGVPPGEDILRHISSPALPELERARLRGIVEEEEALGTVRCALMPDAGHLFEWLAARRALRPGTRVGLITRNNSAAMARTIELIGVPGAFDMALSREWGGGPPKPHAAPLLSMLRAWGVEPEEAVMVGDSRDDVLCGRGAGALCVLVGGRDDAGGPDHVVPTLAALCELLDALDPRDR